MITVGEAEFGNDHVLAGMAFQRKLEKRAWEMGKGAVPIQQYQDFRSSFFAVVQKKAADDLKTEENFANNGWFTGSNVLQKGILADKFADHIYRFRIPSDKISHVRIARTNPGASKVWNVSKYMWDNQRSKTAGSKSNCIKITDWGEGYNYDNNTWSGNANNASWVSFAPTNNASFNSKTAQRRY